MLSFLVWLLIFAIVFALVYWIVGLLPLPPVVRQIVLVALAVIFVIMLIGALIGGVNLPAPRFG